VASREPFAQSGSHREKPQVTFSGDTIVTRLTQKRFLCHGSEFAGISDNLTCRKIFGAMMTENQTCSIPGSNPTHDEIRNILKCYKTVAIVGLSDKPEKDSHVVAMYLKAHGYTIIPVNPANSEILGEKCYPNLASIPHQVDIVDIFRKSDAIPGIVDEAVKIKAKVVWMQLGLAHDEAAQKATNAGLVVVQSKCIKVEHAKLMA
jgi:predicted CoA-binding protein